jgi:hypothetical protein
MKLIFTLAVIFLFNLTSTAQNTDEQIALQLVQKNSEKLGLSPNDVTNSKVSATYVIQNTEIRMVYLQQMYKDIPVYNQMHVLAFKDGLPVSIAGSRYGNIEQQSIPQSGEPQLMAAAAVQKAFVESNITYNQSIQPIATSDNGKTVEFGKLDVSNTDIKATLVWMPVTKGNAELCWQIDISPKNTSDHWLIRVSAVDGTIKNKNNLTVYCNWNHDECSETKTTTNHIHKATEQAVVNGPTIVNGATYNVIPFPAESPIHPGGTQALRTDPWLLAPVGSNATTLKWHSTGTTDYIYTRGNNVFAYEDVDANNIAGISDTSTTTPDPLSFLKTYNFTLAPNNATNQRMAITNLFYWNNIIHDVSYLYGFDEAAGNFQTNNQGRGGTGNDAVLAEAQDGSGTNNANFSTPVDGTAGRMQMYVWTAPNPDRDGDLDNGIILHEYGHGISTRFTGGPANSSCLNNDEQMGEGWSDYFGLMLTHDWATATVNDGFNNPRGIGTYALNQPITGVGIRQYPYTTNMATNPFTYTNVSTVAIPHGIGSVWCTILWDMTWNMIQMDGISPSIYNANAVAGNTAALKLVTEGMRLQPCSPGFVDGRNAILRADTLFFGARYSCAIWNAFARRGVGANASQGSSASRADQTVNFEVPSAGNGYTHNVTQQLQNQNIVFTVTTNALCSGITNHSVVDTLPTNVTHVSGGTYNAGNRTVTFSGITLAAGASQSNNYTVQINNGTYFVPVQHINEAVTTATLPTGWTQTSTTADVWRVSNAQSVSAPYSFFTRDTTIASDQILNNTNQFAVTGATTLSFRHNFDTEGGWDGGVVEISTNNGSTWADLGNYFISNGYNGTLGTGSALANRRAFTGASGGFILSQINLTAFAGQNIRIRFRFASDGSVGTTTGWFVDDVNLISEAAVITKSNLFNNSGTLVSSKGLITKILPGVVPLKLISFSGNKQNSDAQLQWITDNEVGINKFELERSFDAFSYAAIKTTLASNNVNRNQYNYLDVDVTSNLNFKDVVYYRLKIIDNNNKVSYSNTVKINYSNKLQLTIAPNPVKENLVIRGFAPNKIYNCVIADITGKQLNVKQLTATQNSIAVNNLSKGVYVLKVDVGNGMEAFKFIKE